MKFIETLSQVIKHQPKPQPSWATHLVIALSFVIIGAGYWAYNTYWVKSVKAADEISIISPAADDVWFIDDVIGTIEWTAIIDDPLIEIDHFELDYSYLDPNTSSWGNWLEIDHLVFPFEPPLPQTYNWTITDMTPGLYMIKVAAYQAGVIIPLVEGISGAFTIADSNIPVESNTVEFVTDTSSVGEGAGTHSVEVIYTPGGMVDPDPPDVIVTYQITDITTDPNDYTDQGAGTLTFPGGVSGSQMITFDIYDDLEIEGPEDFMITLLTITGGILGDSSTHTVTILDNDSSTLMIISPTEIDLWYIGDTENIKWKIQSLPQDPDPDYYNLYYMSEGNDSEWLVIEENVILTAGMPQVYTYLWEIPVVAYPGSNDYKIKVEAYNYTSDLDALIASGISQLFTIEGVAQLKGTYYSPEYPIYDGVATAHILSLDGFDALASLSDFNSQVEFAIKLIDIDGNYLGPIEFVSLNYNESASELAAKFSSLDLSLVDKVQFRIYMQTVDNTYYPPWVESLNFRYIVETDENVKMGDIVFVGDNHKSVERGNQINYEVMLTPIDEFKDILNTVVLTMATSASGITADPVTINFDGSGGYTTTITLTTTNEAPIANDIPFYIRTIVTDPDRPDLYTEPNPLEGKIDITDGSVIGDFSLFLIEDHKNPAPGGLIIFTVNITKNSSFNEGINFITDIETQLAGIVDPAGTYFDPTGAIPPTESAVNLHVKILDTIDPANLDQEFSFTITGASVNSQITHSVIGYIMVSESGNPYLAITLNLTAPVEGGVSDNLNYPSFTFRLYEESETNPDTYTIQADNLTADDYDSNTKIASIQVNIETGYVADTSTYVGYLRSTRHLWRKATTPFAGKITIDADNPTYAMSFPELIAGDIVPAPRDNIINSIDYTRLTQDFWSTIAGLLPDFNNDNVINSLDVSFLFGNWWKESELP